MYANMIAVCCPISFAHIPLELGILVLARELYAFHHASIVPTDFPDSHREMVSYSMTKAAALAFHEGLSAELRGKKMNAPEIKLTCVHPTWSSTDMIADARAETADPGAWNRVP
jgi:NAD(P)-dependent dehydrogenase (short-subunit alcohol dehydrogenase family)